jgi:hypothetical protein
MTTKKDQIFTTVTILFALFFLLSMFFVGISFKTLLVLVLWFVYFKLRKDQKLFTAAFSTKHVIIVSLLVLVSYSITPFGKRSNKASRIVGTKMYNIASEDGKTKGQVEADIYNTGKVGASYFIIIKDTYKTNQYCRPEQACTDGIEYTYALDLVRENIDDEGSLSSIYCNKDHIPEDPFNYSWEVYSYRSCNADTANVTTDTFLAEFTLGFNSMKDFMATDILNTHEAGAYWFIESQEVDGNSTSTTYAVDLLKAIQNEPIFASYKLNLEEVN